MTTILVVDDSAMLRMQVARAFTSAGYRVLEAADGVAALERLVEAPEIACVVCDVNMPRMSGVEFVETLAGRGAAVPVIMLTTEANPELIGRAKAAGAAGWLLKPCNPAHIVAATRKLTGA